jgi:hypothetical protein
VWPFRESRDLEKASLLSVRARSARRASAATAALSGWALGARCASEDGLLAAGDAPAARCWSHALGAGRADPMFAR